MIMKLITSDAQLVWKALNGIFAVYKPTNVSVYHVRETLLSKLCQDLNELKVREPIDYVRIEGETNKRMTVNVRTSYADNPLIVGPRYQNQDIRLSSANHLPQEACGVLLFGINKGTSIIHKIRESKPNKFFRVKGILGQATDNFFVTGRIRERSTYKFIRRYHIDRICAMLQSSHQKQMFQLCGVDIQSQMAYELAVKGPIRPVGKEVPMIYSIKCVEFNSPEFVLEIVCMNEGLTYLKELIYNVGIELHSTATCSQIQCFQYGLFNLNLAMLRKHWTLQNILNNIKKCEKMLPEDLHTLNQGHLQVVQQT